MYIPTELKVRIKTTKYSHTPCEQVDLTAPYLSYITYIDEKKKLRKEPTWSVWGDKQIDDIKNIPLTGYKTSGVVKRSSEWFGSGRNMFRITHPNNEIEFEITANNMLAILSCCTLINGVIQEKCVLAWDGANMSLIPTSSDIYEEYVNITTIVNKKEKYTYEENGIYKDKNGNEFLCLGQYNMLLDNTKYSNVNNPYLASHYFGIVNLDLVISKYYLFIALSKNQYTTHQLYYDIVSIKNPTYFPTNKTINAQEFIQEKYKLQIDKFLKTGYYYHENGRKFFFGYVYKLNAIACSKNEFNLNDIKTGFNSDLIEKIKDSMLSKSHCKQYPTINNINICKK